jgi:hypothetical protein
MKPAAPRALACALVFACAAGACSSSTAPPAPVVACDSTVAATDTDTFALGDVGVYLDASDPLLAPVRADLASYLGAMWGGAVSVASTAPDGSKRVSIWLSTSPAAAAKIGATLTDGYAIQRVDAPGATTLVVYAKDALDLAWGAYAMLEELGIHFFHPKQELVPPLGAPRLPSRIAVTRAPLVHQRGLQPHTLHPIEYFDTFMQPSADNLADAKLFIDWLVKTGQNYVQWPLLSTVDWNAWKPHMQAIIDYAHSRGVRVGAVPQVWGGSALQNNYVLVSDATKWQSQMDTGLATLMQLPWDVVELALGEFTSADPQQIIDWLNYATQSILARWPNVQVNVQNHVGNYPQLWVKYQGQTVFYYQLPQYCDARLGQSVHTLFFFDLYRDWATYAHPDFHLQHDYLMKELPTRRVAYFPESAYWISADIDVPLFLPEYWYARWLDIHTLSQELAAAGLPAMNGHTEFMSGHEWGYWMIDYFVAKMLWQPDAPLDDIVAKYASAYGSCAGDIGAELSAYVQLQTTYFFDDRLVAYVQGENTTVDLGYLTGLETHPRRVEFEQLLSMSEGDLADFEANVVAQLEQFAARSQPIEDAVAARCRGADATLAPWCDELWDGIAIVGLRAKHAALLYRAMLAYVRGDAATASSKLDAATQVTAQAAQVIARREAQYRFDVGRVTGVYRNPTIYGFGYLEPAHTQCYFTRREEQVRYILENGGPESLLSLPSCTP